MLKANAEATDLLDRLANIRRSAVEAAIAITRRSILGVEPQQVVLGESEAADGRF